MPSHPNNSPPPPPPMSTATTILLFLLLTLNIPNCQSISPESLKFPCQHPHHNSYPFCNTTLPLPIRAQSLLSLLTLSDKIKRLSNNDTGIPRLGIPPYEWWSESLHGIAVNGPGVSFDAGLIPAATSFPQVILTTASFNRTLWFSIASAIAVEARAMYNGGQAGLTFWAPTINVFRDPRWGRGQETPGEDPMVAAAYAIEYVRGFQGEKSKNDRTGTENKKRNRRRRVLTGGGGGGDDELMVSACCKHFTAYDLENWGVYTRYNFNAIVTEQDLQDTYHPPFKSCIQEGKASCLMCSYNAVNGIPACADQDLLQKARTEWGFKGYVTSDCDAVATIYEYQNYTKSPEDAVAIALKAEEDIDKALVNLFMVQLRLGLYDGDPITGKFGKLGPRDVCTSDHKNLALEAARQGMVLLKNDNKFLPLQKNVVSSLAVIGPMANATSTLGGGYIGIPCSPTSIVEGLKRYVKRTTHASGCLDVSCTSNGGFLEAVSISKKADFVIIVAGLDLTQETEDHDRFSLLLPGYQMALITTIAATSEKPVVLVLTGGGPLDVSFAQGDPRIASIIWVGYPGETGGRALAEIIFGDHNPGGKLPMTWYPESFTRVPMNNMNMRSDLSRGYPGRTYRFYISDIVYGFGHGLSYTNYTYNILSAPNKLHVFESMKTKSRNILQQKEGSSNYLYVDEIEEHCDSLRFQMEIGVKNHGPFDGSSVVMVFARVPGSFKGAPMKQLVEFESVHTGSYSDAKTGIIVDPCKHLSIVNEFGKTILPLGDHILMIDDLEHILSIVM
ncbi:Glycoside hydrolase family 3 [Cynara cardunculus var. scolymus]|uniref:Glycoside hydrolase family 3 n=1 Tax=Cynara cardunculus var. scolymus TaxID=59895 RepID=A0A118JUF4_CYNCS|nr:Glycoside hydrolase family 3 [Cynara cardunculus var. scolymus]